MGDKAPDEVRREAASLATLVGEFSILINESADYQLDESVQTVLRQAVQSLVTIHRRLQLAERRYVVAVVGLTNVGKSTLLNALLGGDIAPRRNGPCTSAPIEFVRGDKLSIIAYRRDTPIRHTIPCATIEVLHQQLAELADDAGTDAPRIRKVDVLLPHPLLQHGLVIADTPGFGAAQIDDEDGTHEKTVCDYLRTDVSQVFWVVLAEQGIGNREFQFHNRVFAPRCDDVVVTGCEDWSESERLRFRRRFEPHFRDRIPTFHFVSGLQGLESRVAGDQEGLYAAGITMLEERIGQFAMPQGRLQALRESLSSLADDLAFWLRDYRDDRGEPLRSWWRPDSWDRWSSLRLRSDPLYRRLSQSLNGA